MNDERKRTKATITTFIIKPSKFWQFGKMKLRFLSSPHFWLALPIAKLCCRSHKLWWCTRWMDEGERERERKWRNGNSKLWTRRIPSNRSELKWMGSWNECLPLCVAQLSITHTSHARKQCNRHKNSKIIIIDPIHVVAVGFSIEAHALPL